MQSTNSIPVETATDSSRIGINFSAFKPNFFVSSNMNRCNGECFNDRKDRYISPKSGNPNFSGSLSGSRHT